ncbi:MAG: polynucleotide adenylyltransferase PcnB [Pseudomonadota bacterium]|nr:MAG: polynucleotide adenylyltransferase PcnB [Pseudomonadota bacterium]
MEDLESIPSTATHVARSDHNISRGDISDNALKVLYRLKKAGYAAYLVGGGVRDLLLGGHPKDFDVATDATPEEVKKLFRNCRLIGRRFRLAHVYFGDETIEVATFRAHHAQAEDEGHGVVEDGMLVRDNVYGSVEDDAWRRDFTVNALYYNIRDFSVVDFTGGMPDLKQRVLRMIGDPEVRLQEDPVRMLRAVRLAAKLAFEIAPDTEQQITAQAERLGAVPPARLFDEVLKMFHGGHALATLHALRKYGLFTWLFPATEACLASDDGFTLPFVERALQNTDQRIAQEKSVTPAFLFAALLWTPVARHAQRLQAGGMAEMQSLQVAGDDVISQQLATITIPRRFQTPMREIWAGQARLTNRRGKRPMRLVETPRFRAAYDFLLLRYEAGEEELGELCGWWTAFQDQDNEGRRRMCDSLHKDKPRRRRGRRRRKTATPEA